MFNKLGVSFILFSTGHGLSVVHIRVVCEHKPELYPCDYCLETFTSEASLSSHILTEHKPVDIQDVFVCTICNCCLLSQSDILEHAALRHQVNVLKYIDTFIYCS